MILVHLLFSHILNKVVSVQSHNGGFQQVRLMHNVCKSKAQGDKPRKTKRILKAYVFNQILKEKKKKAKSKM